MRIKDFTTRALALITMFLSVATASATMSIGDVITVNLNGIDAYFTITGINPNTVEMGRKHYDSYETFAKTCTLNDIEIPVTVTASDGSAYAVTSLCPGCFWVNFFSSGTTLKTVSMPPTVTSIGNSAFASNRGLESVEGLERVTTLGNTVFGGCPSLTTLDCLDNVETIGTSCFSGCKLIQSLSLPKVKSIPSLCFANCRALNNIYLPEAIEIGDSAFQSCRALKKIELPKVKKIGMWFFYGCSALEEVILGSNVESIEKRAFLSTGAVKTIHISTVQPPVWLGTDAYLNASGNDIRSQITVYVPVGCAATYRAATFWSGFKEFVEMEDPSPAIAFADANVKALCVANWDTNGDGELSEAEAAAVTDLGEVFKNDTTITSFNELQYFTGLTEIPNSAFYNCQYLNEVIIPENVTTIGHQAFHNCLRLASITIPEGVTTIGMCAFQSCPSLLAIHIPASVTLIDYLAFGWDSSSINYTNAGFPSVRESITVAEGNTVYDSRDNCNAIIETATNTLMYGCSNTIIPSSVTIIGNQSFSNSVITSIVIPRSVTSILGFTNCMSLTSVTVENPTPITIDSRWAFNGSYNATLYVPAGSKAAYEAADYWKNFSEIVEMENTSPKITNLLSNKWSGTEYSVQAATFDSGVNYGDWNDSNSNYNQIVGVPEADANGRNWYEVEYTCNWQEMTAPLNNWCEHFGDIYARRTFYYDEEMPEELFLACGHDDAPCEYYLNGELIWSVTDGWFEQEIYKLTSAQKALLRPGELNVLAFHVHQNYGGMYADCGLYTSLSEMGISNKCGDNLTWSFDYETGTLTISGTGDMYDFSYYSEDIPNTPWVGIRNLIKHIDVQDGATRIGSDAFLECSALTSVTLPNSVTSIGGSAFLGCSSLTDVYCYTENVPETASNTFSYSPISSATLHVPAASLEAYRTTAPWSAFGTIVPIDGFVINDETTSLDVVTEESGKAVIFTHDFNGEWEALYLPFAINYDDIKADFDLAEIDGVVQNDQNNDGIADITVLSIIGFKGQHTTPNKPYLIRAKNAGNQTINFEDVTVYPTEELTFDCASFSTKYDFTGSYYTLNASALANRYVVQGGELVKGASSLAPCRWYMTATARNGAPLNLPNRIRIMPVEDVITGVEDLNANVNLRDSLFDLQGRKVTNPQKGIYIQNGKKVALK